MRYQGPPDAVLLPSSEAIENVAVNWSWHVGLDGRLSAGATSSGLRQNIWPTPGRDSFRSNLGADGFVGRAPVGCLPPNGYGLAIWPEMPGSGRATGTLPGIRTKLNHPAACPRGAAESVSYDPKQPQIHIPRRGD
jgi:hypothetical protein